LDQPGIGLKPKGRHIIVHLAHALSQCGAHGIGPTGRQPGR